MKPDDDELFEIDKPEPFLAFVVGVFAGYLFALVMVLLVFPVLGMTNWHGHGVLILAVVASAFGLAAVETLCEWVRRTRK